MRSFGALLPTLVLIAPALAQTPAPAPGSASRPAVGASKPATATPAAAPKPNPIAESYAAIPEAERIAIQSDLIWTGHYNGTLSPEFGERAVAAVKAFQKKRGGKETGVLNPQERAALAASARPKQEVVGWRMLNDASTGTRLGIPTKLAPQTSTIISGSRWASARGEVQIETFRIAAPGTTLQATFEQQQKVGERKVSYKLLRPDFFIVSGLQGLKKVYVRGAFKDGEVRGFTILYDQAVEGTLDPVVIAMSSAFTAFPPGVAAPPPLRRKVEYGSGIVVDAGGHVVTTREVTDGCQLIMLTGLGPADLVAEDNGSQLALLRVYGARDLVPAPFGRDPGDGEATLLGIADPQSQGGAAAASTISTRLTTQGSSRKAEPLPPPGFAGAAVLARDGRVVGLVDLRPQVLAGPPSAGAQSAFIPFETIVKFLGAHHVAASVSAAAGTEKAVASVVRVTCVRK